jgi:hypothetical protein
VRYLFSVLVFSGPRLSTEAAKLQKAKECTSGPLTVQSPSRHCFLPLRTLSERRWPRASLCPYAMQHLVTRWRIIVRYCRPLARMRTSLVSIDQRRGTKSGIPPPSASDGPRDLDLEGGFYRYTGKGGKERQGALPPPVRLAILVYARSSVTLAGAHR